jgi:hypothetical protein
LALLTAAATVLLSCGEKDVGPGDPRSELEVVVATTGEDVDSDGYAVVLDGVTSRSVGVNGTVTFSNLTAGSHSVELLDVAGNCAVAGSNPTPVTLGSGVRVSVALEITCVTLNADLSVAVTTTGVDLDPDGYVVTVRPEQQLTSAAAGRSSASSADSDQSQPVAVNGTVTFPGLAPGDYTVQLNDVAANCTVAEANPATANLPPSGTATSTFTVTCSARVGDLAVTASTTGSALDPDGYTVTMDGGASQAIGINGSVTFLGLAEGNHAVELTGVAGNCTVSGTNPQTVAVPFGATATGAFSVTCSGGAGDLAVTASTTGSDLDPDGYTVTVDGGASQAIGINGSVTFLGLAEGDHTVELTGAAGNCTVSGPNPRTVTVPSGGTATTTFAMTCVTRQGDLAVNTSTTGQDLDPDGYTVTVDGGPSQAIGINGSVSFTGLAEGDHTVELTGVAGNCTVSGPNPRTVTVSFGATAATAFAVTCTARVGDLTVTTATSGQDLDPDGYTVTVDGGPSQAIEINGSVTFTGLAEGDHTVELTGVASKCTVSGANPRTVTVPYGGTATTAFAVTCTSPGGDLAVSTTTTGSDLDPDGYTVTVIGEPSQAVGINGSVTFTGLAEGDHTVELTGVAGNCTVSGPNPRTVTVPSGNTATTTFAVTCVTRQGDLAVSTSTTGQDLDPDGYTVTVDGGPSQAIGINGSVTFTGLPVGDHTVELTGVAGNCTVSGANPRTVTVPFDGTVTTAFGITCAARVGDLDVSATTTGSDLDPDGYTVTIDGVQSQPVDVNGTVSFVGLAEGDHTVALTGVASNCNVSAPNPRTVTVPFGGTATTSFAVTCTARVGDLDVSTTTTGSDLDPDGYTVSVDGGQSQTIGSNGSVTFSGLAEGDHTVELTGVAGNCTVSGANPRTVTVPFGGTVTTAFGITCVARVGDLNVTTTTTGSDLDPDGYTVSVDGGPSQAIGINGSVTFTGLAEGGHTVELTGLAGNCSVTGANPRTVTVPFGGTGTTTFAVTCVIRRGDLEVNTSTTGQDLDPDGYTVTVDGGASQAIGINGSVTFTGLTEGDHSVELTGVAGNCTVGGANPRTVSVPYAGTASTSFAVTCAALGDLQVNVSTTGQNLDPDGYTVTLDGTTSQPIAINGSVTFTGLVEGDHTVELSGVAAACSVVSPNPQTANVPSGGTAFVTFDVTCGAVSPSLVQTIETWRFTPPSPDPAGITYLGHVGTLLISDSEVDEMSIFEGVNLFETSLSGSLVDTSTTMAFTNEPTGVTWNPTNNHLFVSDDGKKEVYEVDPGPDGRYGTSDDIVTSFDTAVFGNTDPEGVTYDSSQGVLFIADGVNAEVFRVSPGSNGVFDGVPPAGDDQVTSFDTEVHGLLDPEGIAYDSDAGHLYIVGKPVTRVFHMTTTGTLLGTIDISAANADKPAGLAYAPSSVTPGQMNLWIVDRGVDNNTDPQENDGLVYEFSLP